MKKSRIFVLVARGSVVVVGAMIEGNMLSTSSSCRSNTTRSSMIEQAEKSLGSYF